MVHFRSLFATAAALASLVAAAPSPSPSITPTGQEYYLKTSVINDSDHSSKDGLYVSAYHTGAGINDVVLEANRITAAKGFLNGTYQEFNFGTDFRWGLNMGGAANYAAWEFTEINGGLGSGGFFLNETGLQWNNPEFGGWLGTLSGFDTSPPPAETETR